MYLKTRYLYDIKMISYYIKSVRLNGKEHRLPYIEHSDIAAGGKLVIEMCDTPALWYDADILSK